ncbi:iron complex outermembrane recepter protein [Reichenbachiella faecimaris]|uniref:Iron complex outermembrane recepter protein n=1 Tax=Reichenbachiella faecimaris TaxID=692418 RepID=A0A1W2GLV5_REIFA|nr:TonB-dependent receptor [Reichenbachiella faecimaris]SMD37266.1 iron complex outermembrane recepter protein [Reichenbachiella faecimaris]
MKNYYQLVFSMLFGMGVLLVSSSGAFAQGSMVSGTIKDAESGEAIPGVNVIAKGTSNGVVTDIDGNYSLQVEENTVLVISYVGFETQEIKVGTQSIIDVSLGYDVSQLGEVVVIGYGEVDRGDVTGSVIAVDSDDFNKGAISTPQELLIGKVPGVVITSQGGAAGTGSTIRIRGGSSLRANNDPLIVIDGMPLESRGISGMANPLATINPNDIETFTVLKDASATAIYGSRASNGVILITTKQGSQGKMTVSYNGNVSVGVPVKTLDVYSGDEYRAIVNERVTNDLLDDNALVNLGSENTNWQDAIYENAVSTDHNVSVGGNIQGVPVRGSVGYTNQNGILKNNNMERTSFTLSASPTLLDGDLTMNINAKGSFIQNNFSNPDAIGSAVSFDPTQPIMNGNTRYGGYFAWTNHDPALVMDPEAAPINIATHNPVAQLNYRDNTSSAQRYILGGKFDYRMPFLPALKATLNLGMDYYDSQGDDVVNPLASWSEREPAQNIKHYEQTRKNNLLDFYLNYNKTFGGDHKVDLTGGYSYQHFHVSGNDSNKSWDETDAGADTVSYKREYFLLSFFGRMNYTLKDKYLVTATVRNDRSSRFGEDARSGIFPAVAVAWKLNEEGFLNGADFLSELKIRAGWGQTGQQDIGDDNRSFYPYIPTYTGSQQGAYYQFGNSFYATQRPNPYDANIKWETTTTQNIGLDFGFLNGRFSGSVDLYKRETEDLINEIPIAAGSNFSNFLITNVGSLENKGVEVALTAGIISTPDLSWEISGNLTYNVNEITKLTQIDDPSYPGYNTGEIDGGVGNNVQINSVGHPVNTFYLFSQVYGQDGMPIEGLYVDKTGEGGVVSGNELNKYYLNNPAPEYLIGISSKVRYKSFDFSFSGRLNLNNYVYNNNASSKALYQNLYNQAGYTANILTAVEETEFTTAQYWSDIYMEDASFFRMDNISVGYNFDKIFSDQLNGRISFTVQNAFVITDYSGLDPEINSGSKLGPNVGIDNNIYPRPRTYMLGINLNF